MKSLYLTFEDKIFEKMKAIKEKTGMTWERFIEKLTWKKE